MGFEEKMSSWIRSCCTRRSGDTNGRGACQLVKSQEREGGGGKRNAKRQLLALAYGPRLLLHGRAAALAVVFVAIGGGACRMRSGQRKRVAARDPLVEQITKELGIVVARDGLPELCLERGGPRVDLLAREGAVVPGLV
jgi:hypothetical protein